MSTTVFRGEIIAGYPAYCRGYFHDSMGVRLTQADVAQVTATITEVDGTSDPIEVSYEVSEVVFDTLQSWGQDDTGYNVAVRIDGAYLPTANKQYQVLVEIEAADSSGDVYPGQYLLDAE